MIRAAICVGLVWLTASSAWAAWPAAHDYTLNCRGCHGSQGQGTDGHVPSLLGLDRLAATRQGRAYLVQVPGVANVGLSDARIAALLNYTLERFAECGFAPYTEAEVTVLRAPRRSAAGGEVIRLQRPQIVGPELVGCGG